MSARESTSLEVRPLMFFAEGVAFWKWPTSVEVIGILVGLGSIWVSWWLARRDIKKRLDEATKEASAAARDEVRRVARAVLQTGISATIRSLELAREVCHGKRWSRAAELCSLACEQLARVLAQPAADESIQTELREVAAGLQDCVTSLRKKKSPQEGKGEVPEGVLKTLGEAVLALHRVDSRMMSIQPEGDHGH